MGGVHLNIVMLKNNCECSTEEEEEKTHEEEKKTVGQIIMNGTLQKSKITLARTNV